MDILDAYYLGRDYFFSKEANQRFLFKGMHINELPRMNSLMQVNKFIGDMRRSGQRVGSGDVNALFRANRNNLPYTPQTPVTELGFNDIHTRRMFPKNVSSNERGFVYANPKLQHANSLTRNITDTFTPSMSPTSYSRVYDTARKQLNRYDFNRVKDFSQNYLNNLINRVW